MTVSSRRRYNPERRARQAAQTRAEIVAAATELFRRDGWRATTIAAVAARAAVVPDTIYAGFASKAGLLAAAKDAARDADEADVPFFKRPTFRWVRAGSAEELPVRLAALLTDANARTWQLDAVWRDAAAFEPSVREQLEQRELDRRAQIGRAAGLLLTAPVDQRTVDAIWVITGSDVYAKLVDAAGLTQQQYTEWLTMMLRRLLDRAPADVEIT